MRRIGIDVGGTNTDAVLLEGPAVRAAVKAPTTEDVTTGILDALAALVEALGGAPGPVDAVMIGTTHFTNAVVERRELAPVAAVRIGLPASAALVPFVDWPDDLARRVRGAVYLLEGGHEYDGRPLVAFDERRMEAVAREIRSLGVESVAVTSVFSPLAAACEERAAAVLAAIAPELDVTLSHDIGRIGLLERENAALLNAALVPLARRTVEAFTRALAASGIAAPLYLTQNDGTVMRAELARRRPVFGFASGPTNSMRGAAALSGIDEAIVVDVGGTTTDVGCLRAGFPREANRVVAIGGVRTLFRMPDVLSIGLGGGSVVDAASGRAGPRSVGHRIGREAIVFGGETLTATDVAVAAGRLRLGEPERLEGVDPDLVRRCLSWIEERIAEAVDRVRTDARPLPLVAVGGGAFLVPERLPGIERVVRVAHQAVANAVGAAIAQVGGEVDRVFTGLARDESIAQATAIARERALAAGAEAGTVRVVEVEDLPLAYLPGDARRVRVRVVGDAAAAAPGRLSRPGSRPG